MTYEEAIQHLSEMESRFEDGFSSLDRMYLDSLYFALFGKEITNKGCSNCYRDAFIEISVKLKQTKAMPKKSEYVLKPGAIITFFGERQCYTNANMTDEAALRFLSQNPLNESLFEKLPADWKERVASSANQEAEVADDEKDNLIATLTAENEALKQEIESLKASSTGKKRKKKSETEAAADTAASTADAESAPSEETAEVEQPSEDTAPLDNEVSLEEPEEESAEE